MYKIISCKGGVIGFCDKIRYIVRDPDSGILLVTTVMTGFIGYMFHKLKAHEAERELSERKRLDEIMAREKAINEALRALCHDRILQGYRYYRKHSGISPADLETMTKLYNAYHALGGNGTITAVYEKICGLPLKEGD